jgi:VanZ family protein
VKGRTLAAWAPVVLWMALLFAVSSREAPAVAGRIPDWVTHGGAYAVLGALAARALDATVTGTGVFRTVAAIVLSTAYGVSDEIHQSFVPGRTADPWDVAKDAGGAMVGALAWRAVRGGRGAARAEAEAGR